MPDIRETIIKCRHCRKRLHIDIKHFDANTRMVQGWLFCPNTDCGKVGAEDTITYEQMVED